MKLKQVIVTAMAILTLATMTSEAGDFRYSTNVDGLSIRITGYSGLGGEVFIPDSIGDLPVTLIDRQAFKGNTQIHSISIPDSVTEIEYQAFGNCVNLTTVDFGIGIKVVGSSAFYGCSSLQDVVLPSGVEEIGYHSFSDCTSLESIEIPSSVQQCIGAIYGCTNLNEINVNEGNTNYISVAGVVFNYDQTELIQLPGGRKGRYQVPETVEVIQTSALRGCSQLSSIIIPDSLMTIESASFWSCDNLTNIYMLGNAPSYSGWGGAGPFSYIPNAIVYYTPGSSGWSDVYHFTPSLVWDPVLDIISPTSGTELEISLHITATTNIPVVVEITDNLMAQNWSTMASCVLTNRSYLFNGAGTESNSTRFYRVRMP